MKSYLCIGGPLHGTVQTINESCGLQLRVPEPSSSHLCSLFSGGDRCDCQYGTARTTAYTVKQVLISERSRANNGDALSVTVSVEAQVQVLAHESVLTTEELAAWFRKLRSDAIHGGVQRALYDMKLPRR